MDSASIKCVKRDFFFSLSFDSLVQGLCIFSVIKGVNSIPYRPVWSEYTVPARKPVCITPLFCTGKNTSRTGQFRVIPTGTKKKFFIFLFLSFVIFEFLLGQNDNLFALTY